MFSQYGFAEVDSSHMNEFFSAQHWLGTDSLGRDLWVRTWRGARVSLSIGFIAAVLNACIGAVIGGVSGYYGGKLDMVIMRIIDVLYGIPSLIVTILVMVVLGSGIPSLIVALIMLVGWNCTVCPGRSSSAERTGFCICSKSAWRIKSEDYYQAYYS